MADDLGDFVGEVGLQNELGFVAGLFVENIAKEIEFGLLEVEVGGIEGGVVGALPHHGWIQGDVQMGITAVFAAF